MATTQRSVNVAELGAKSKDELLVVAQDLGLEDGAGLAQLRREDLLNRLHGRATGPSDAAEARKKVEAMGVDELKEYAKSLARDAGLDLERPEGLEARSGKDVN